MDSQGNYLISMVYLFVQLEMEVRLHPLLSLTNSLDSAPFSAYCAAGFRSDLECYEGECPPGLFCDTHIDRCCPLLLPLSVPSSPRSHQKPPRRPGGNRPPSSPSIPTPPVYTTIEEPPRRPHPKAASLASGYKTPFSIRESRTGESRNGSPYGFLNQRGVRHDGVEERGEKRPLPMRRYPTGVQHDYIHCCQCVH